MHDGAAPRDGSHRHAKQLAARLKNRSDNMYTASGSGSLSPRIAQNYALSVHPSSETISTTARLWHFWQTMFFLGKNT